MQTILRRLFVYVYIYIMNYIIYLCIYICIHTYIYIYIMQQRMGMSQDWNTLFLKGRNNSWNVHVHDHLLFGIHVKYPKHWKILSFYEHFRYLFTTDSFYEHFGEAKRFMELWVTKSHGSCPKSDKMSSNFCGNEHAFRVATFGVKVPKAYWCVEPYPCIWSQNICWCLLSSRGLQITNNGCAVAYVFFPLGKHIMVDEYTNNSTVQYQRFINIYIYIYVIHIQYSPSLHPIPL